MKEFNLLSESYWEDKAQYWQQVAGRLIMYNLDTGDLHYSSEHDTYYWAACGEDLDEGL